MTKYKVVPLEPQQKDILDNLHHIRYYLRENESDDYPVGLFKAYLELETAVEYDIYGDTLDEVKLNFDRDEGDKEKENAS